MSNNKTQQEYLRRISLALEFIRQNLNKPIRLEDVASASFFSQYHFHRIFHALVGETVNDYISRKRMEKAACMLIYQSEKSVSDVAADGGYSSAANFSKAFKLYFGVSPSELREYRTNKTTENKNSKIGKLYSKYGKEFNPRQLYPESITQSGVFGSEKLKELLMKVNVQEMADQSIACLSSDGGYNLDSVYATWDKLNKWADANNVEQGCQNRFAICYDNPVITPEDKCRYDATVVIDKETNVTAPFSRKSIPGGKYAIIHFKDAAEKISGFITELCSQWFPNSGYEPDDYPMLFNYQNDSRKDGFLEMDVYIKLKELKVS